MAVVELGSIAAAARHLQMSPAAVAQRVQALEATLGSRLIMRSGRTVTATAAGNRVLRRAHSVLKEIRDLQSAASESEMPAGPLRLGLIPSALLGIAPSLLKQWVERFPHIEVYIEPGSSTLLYGKVLSGDLDAAVLVHPLFELPKVCEWRCLREESLILLTPAGLHVEDPFEIIRREPFIRPDRNMVAGKLADDYLRRHGVHPQVRFELNGIDSVARLVAEGLGVAIVPDCLVLGITEGAVTRWPLPEPTPVRKIGVLWMRSGLRCQLAEAFVALLAPSSRSPRNKGTPSSGRSRRS